MGVVVGLLDRLVLREFVGVERHLIGGLEQRRQAVGDAAFQRARIGRLLRRDLLDQPDSRRLIWSISLRSAWSRSRSTSGGMLSTMRR